MAVTAGVAAGTAADRTCAARRARLKRAETWVWPEAIVSRRVCNGAETRPARIPIAPTTRLHNHHEIGVIASSFLLGVQGTEDCGCWLLLRLANGPLA